ncbi:DUF2487 family protein [Paenibacillus odorifer]|uniref:DUF2487 family protein n=1 Tax=Paenibacillus odorifer TaxID=189426 RepID=UPI0028985859|nr:DUF2487 family protein [Paenibacillus odorifer]
MKFSDFEVDTWEENRKFYDTCLIPFTGLSGLESPPETVQALERLRNFMDMVEIPFKGRIVTYPAIQYAGEGYVNLINEICQKVKSSGFQHVVVLTADVPLQESQIYESDLVLSLPIIEASHEGKNDSEIRMKIQDMWRR